MVHTHTYTHTPSVAYIKMQLSTLIFHTKLHFFKVILEERKGRKDHLSYITLHKEFGER